MSKHPDIAKVREYLIESGYPEDGDALLSLAAVEAELESKATIESALTKAEAVAWEIRGKPGKPWLRCTEEVYHDHVRRVGQEHARALYAHAPPAAPVESRYECRECDNCGHAGINDANLTQGACFSCEWSGPEPVEDKCPGCGDEGCMTAACPKCGARYRLIAELEPAILPAEPVASVPDGWLLGWARAAEIEKTQRHRSKREGSALAVFVHAEKNETYSVPVYAPPTNQEGAAP